MRIKAKPAGTGYRGDMEHALSWIGRPTAAQCRELAWPKEHGSWSLALEPLALALLAAPSAAGGWLALAVVAGFFARRPLKIACRDQRPERRADARAVVGLCGVVALVAVAATVSLAGWSWCGWLTPSAVAGALFLSFDVRNAGREEAAEIAGSAAFAMLPAALAVLGGSSPVGALALALVMCGRSIPTVLGVRAALRGAKGGPTLRWPAVLSALVALAVGLGFAATGFAPWAAVAALALLAARSVGLLVYPRPALRARTIGMMEAGLGVGFVVAVGASWSA